MEIDLSTLSREELMSLLAHHIENLHDSPKSKKPEGKRDRVLPFIPRGLSRTEAAFYIGVGPTLFDEMVKDKRMPRPKVINSRRLWDRVEVDACFAALPADEPVDPFAFMDDL